MPTPPLVIAHRGASAAHLENSLAAFRAAVAMGVDGVELDVHDTADGEIVVHHDPAVAGTAIGAMGFTELQSYRLANGESVPRLADVLPVLGGDVTAFIEVKSLRPAHDDRLLACLDASPAPARCHVHSFDHRIVARLGARRAGLVVGLLSTSYPVRPFAQLADAGATELWQHESLIDAPLALEAAERGVRLYAWTVDEPERMRQLAALGVDGLCTNRPDLARRVLG